MYEEPEDGDEDHEREARGVDDRVKDTIDSFRMHAELCAVFEGGRKFDAELRSALDPELAREIQKTVAKLEKSKQAEVPVLAEASVAEAEALLDFPAAHGLSTNDYHIHRRPGEVMIVRWLQGEQVESYYARLQAHFDAALGQFREDERQSQGWKQNDETTKFLDAIDKVELKMEERYLRPLIREHKLFILSTQTADEMDILHLTDAIMGVGASAVVGAKSAPSDEPTDSERAWFFKLFALRGVKDAEERMCFFTYLQKADDESW